MDMFFDYIKFDEVIKISTLLVSSILAIKAIIEYQRSQNWKKNEFLAREIKEFFADKDVKRVLLIIDWHTIDLQLYESEMPENKDRVLLYEEEVHLKNALAATSYMSFSAEETIIRKSIDEFLVKLSMFQNYIDNNLITVHDLKPYLHYWISRIGDKNKAGKNPIYIENLWDFIKKYEYTQVLKLLKSFGYNLKD